MSYYDFDQITGFILIDSFLAKDKYGLNALYSAIRHIAIPVLLISFYQFSIITRNTIEQINIIESRNYIKAAIARGETPLYILKNSIYPNIKYKIIKEIIISFKDYLSLILAVEYILCWPGLGSWMINAIKIHDYTVILNGIFIIITAIITAQTLINFILEAISLNKNKEL